MPVPSVHMVARTLGVVAVLACAVAPASAQISDTSPPHLVTLNFAPNAVDVTGGSQSVTVTATVTDDLSGTCCVWVQFVSPSGQQRQPLNFLFLSRSAGTALDGVYQGTFQMPRFSESGTWKVSSLQFQDNAGNFSNLTTNNLVSLGLPTDLVVTSTPDSQGPTVSNIAVAPAIIDTSAAPQTITFQASVVEDVAGVDPFRTFLLVLSPSGQQFWFATLSTLVSGDALNGVWGGSITFPQYSEAGNWVISSVQMTDLAANQSFLNTAALQASGLTAGFTVVSSPTDTTLPQLTGLTLAPVVFDTSAASRDVAITMTATDNLAGVDQLCASFRSPSGGQNRFTCAFPHQLIAGTALNGTWQTTVFFPQFSEGGTWTLSSLQVRDAVSNTRFLTTANLTAMGLPTQLTIFRPSQTPDATVTAAGGTVSDTIFGNRASVTLPAGAVNTATDVAIDVLSSSLGLATPQGFSAGTLFVNVDFNPPPAMPFPAPGLTIVLPFSVFKPPGTLLHLFRLDPVSGLLVRAVSVTGGNVVGRVNADGLSATFTGVARLSTVVGFFPTGVAGDVNGDGTVDCADIAIVKSTYGKRAGQLGFDSRADLNGNGVVDINDLAAVSRQVPPGSKC
jgi:hypothetical protein